MMRLTERINQLWRRTRTLAVWLMVVFSTVLPAHGGGPRYVTGQPYFAYTGEGNPIGWRQPTLLYSTDPGPLSGSVNHAAADAIVAAAASVWNVPVASITVAQGAPLAEDVSGQNVYLGSAGVVFPADVMSTNAASVPLAIVYDADGTVTDTLLGSGASSPSSCRQNAVTETVDSFDRSGFILHAIIIVNGRCSGPAPQQQLQLQYQLERIFGRVLGLAWSQANDNVYTGTPTPTAQQALNWPVMHPLDILCGLYTYQCLPQPFTLRADDIASLVSVYPNYANQTLPPGKQPTYASALSAYVPLRFPSGEGMAGVNVVAQVQPYGNNVPQPWVTSSTISGYAFRRSGSSPFVVQDQSPAGSFGTHDPNAMATSLLTYVPVTNPTLLTGLVLSTEPINPLYTGAYALGINGVGEIAPSGSNLTQQLFYKTPGSPAVEYYTIADAAQACGNGADGTFYAPMQMPASGWWNGQICAYGHVAYTQLAMRAGRSLTVEVTALDANGLATTTKARPAIGIYAPDDAPSGLPSVAVAAQAFNALGVGTTTLTAGSTQQTSLNIAFADQRGDGRPDYNYQARVFYADTVSPAVVPATGAQAVITGIGFRPGNVVMVNGVGVTVTGWTQTSIAVTLPAMSTVNAASGIAVDVIVRDLGTGATSTMTGAVTYLSTQTPPPTMRVLSAPAGPLYTGSVTPQPYTVQELAADGITPIAGEPVSFTLTNPAAGTASPGVWSACGAPTCTLMTDTSGTASSVFTPNLAGTVTFTAADTRNTAVAVSRSATVLTPPAAMLTVTSPGGTAYATQPAGTFAVQVLSAPVGTSTAAPMPNQSVRFSVTAGSARVGGCAASICTVVTDSNGMAQAAVTPIGTGLVTVQATDSALTQSVSLNALSWADSLAIVGVPADGSLAGNPAGNFALRLVHGDGSTPDPGQTVSFSAPAGVSFGGCGSNVCSATTDSNGYAQLGVLATVPGTFTLQAQSGGLTASTSFTVVSAAPQLQLVSLPSGPVPVGTVAATPFTVRLVDAYGNPMGGYLVQFLAPENQAYFLACGQSPRCDLTTAPDGTVSTPIMPLIGSYIPLNVSIVPVQLNVSITGSGALRHLTVLKQPGSAGAIVGQPQTLILQVTGPDGVTPARNELVDLITQSGLLSIVQCQFSACTVVSDQNGQAAFTATPFAPGLVTLEAHDEASAPDTVSLSFMAIEPPDVLTVASQPGNGALVGVPAATALRVRVLAPDGVTAEPGRSVMLAVLGGAAGLTACGGASVCTLTADASGLVTSAVTPLAAGEITISASEGGGSVAASFNAANPPPDQMQLLSAPGSGAVAGQIASPAFTVRLTLADGVTPQPGQAVLLAVSAGQATLTACGQASCSLTTAADGTVGTSVQPLAAGTISLIGSTVSWGQLVSVSTSFSAAPAPDLLVITSAPPATDLVGTAVTFAVQALLADGLTPAAAKTVSFQVSGAAATLGGCAGALCSVHTDAQGHASITIIPTAAGLTTVTASEGSATVSISIMSSTPPPPPPPPPSQPDTIVVLSAPSGSSPVGQANATAFAVRIIGADGVSGAAGRSVRFTLTAGQASLSACAGANTCGVLTDLNGDALTSTSPTAAGQVTITAVEDAVPANVATASFTAVAMPVTPPPVAAQQLTLVSGPGASVFAGMTAATPLAVRLTLTDGVTPVAGVPVTLSGVPAGGTGGVLFVACGSTACTLLTDAAGLVSSGVTGSQAGAVTLSAAAPAPAPALPVPVLAVPFEVIADQVSLIALEPQIYLAAGTPLTLALNAQASENGSSAAGQPVTWSASAGILLAQAQTATAADGTTSDLAALPALAPGVQAAVTACARFPAADHVCAAFHVTGVAAGQLQVTIVTGGLQTLSAATSPQGYAPVVAQVMDASGHPVTGAAVTIYQTVTALAGACPVIGRCPAAPILNSQVSAAVTDAQGEVSVPALTADLPVGTTQQTQLAFSAGTQGFAATVLTTTP